MARYRKVDPRVYSDERVRKLSRPAPNGRDCWMYLLTAKEAFSMPGVIPAGAGAMADTLRWDVQGFRAAFAEVEALGMAKADFDASLVWVPNALKYNEPENPNVILSWASIWEEITECDLKREIHAVFRAHCEARGPGFLAAFEAACPAPRTVPGTLPATVVATVPPTVPGTVVEIREQGAGNREQEALKPLSAKADLPVESAGFEDLDDAASEPTSLGKAKPEHEAAVFAHWKATMGLNGHTVFSSKRRKAVRARLREGYSADALKQAVDGCKVTPFNMGENDRGEKFCDLELICRDAQHVDRFIRNATDPPKPKGNGIQSGRVSSDTWEGKHAPVGVVENAFG